MNFVCVHEVGHKLAQMLNQGMAARQTTRNIALAPHFHKYVQNKIESGRYQSASEVVRESLRIMEQHELEPREAISDVREKIRAGYDQVRRGETLDPNEVFAEIKSMSKGARKAAKKPK
ncbi:MAG TPA: type II toxin-antitoxin system ParD family antitoxin [Tepidisphaeraceae bacterium]|jgi:antitoxin ParD1/3/4|nr:type II toxin-antitoxin system ParD family antitoxin [Tepidisphaeraceae bacterium]